MRNVCVASRLSLFSSSLLICDPSFFFRAILRRQRERRTDRWESCTHSPRFPPSYEKGQFVRKSRRGEKGGKKKTDEAEEMGQKAQHTSTVKGGGGVRGD